MIFRLFYAEREKKQGTLSRRVLPSVQCSRSFCIEKDNENIFFSLSAHTEKTLHKL
jgi:hypothetical protein